MIFHKGEAMVTKVSAAIIRNENNNILICQRKAGGSCGFMWEFPGGKQDEHESADECIIRECREELGVTIKVSDIFMQMEYSYPERDYAFTFFNAQITEGTPSMLVHNSIVWEKADNLSNYTFCPADKDVIKKLSEKCTKEGKR